MTTPWIRTHAKPNNRWDLLVGNVVFADYRTAIEVRRLEDRIRQYAKSMTWDEATARAAAEEKDHRWKPLSRKQRKANRENRPSTTASNPEQGPSPSTPPPLLPSSQPETPPLQLDLQPEAQPAPPAAPSGTS